MRASRARCVEGAGWLAAGLPRSRDRQLQFELRALSLDRSHGDPGAEELDETGHHGESETEASARAVLALVVPEVSASFPVTVADTTAPSLEVPAALAVEGDRTGGAEVILPAARASDRVDPSPVVSCDASSGFFPLGATPVICSATDASGNVASASFEVTVLDTTAPSLEVPRSLTVEGDTAGGAGVTLPAAKASDRVDAAPSVSCDASSGFFPLGTTPVTCTAADASGNEASASFEVTVVDTTAPTLSATATPGRIWPPDHRQVAVDLSVDAADVVDASLTLTAVAISSEPDDERGGGDGNTRGDVRVVSEAGVLTASSDAGPAVVFDPLTGRLSVAAERSGSGPGREYRIEIVARDASGNEATARVVIGVPRSVGAAAGKAGNGRRRR